MGLKSQAAFEAQAVDFLEKDEMRVWDALLQAFQRVQGLEMLVAKSSLVCGRAVYQPMFFTVVLALLILIVGSDS